MNISFYYFTVLFNQLPKSESCNFIWELPCVPSPPAIIFEFLALEAELFRYDGFELNQFTMGSSCGPVESTTKWKSVPLND